MGPFTSAHVHIRAVHRGPTLSISRSRAHGRLGPALSISSPWCYVGIMPFENELPLMMTITEVAEQVHVHPKTIRRMIKRGVMPCIRHGNIVRILRGDFADALARMRTDRLGPNWTAGARPVSPAS